MADSAPEFGNAPSFINDVQFTHEFSQDKQAITFMFGNFGAAISPSGLPLVVRTFSLVLPLKNVAAGARLVGTIQGDGFFDAGTGGMLFFRAGGISQAFDRVFGPDDAESFAKEINLPIPAGGDLRMTIGLVLEGSVTDPKAQATVNVTTVDVALSAGEPELSV